MSIMVKVSYGELFDKISILRIKSERMSNPEKLANVARELDQLERQEQTLMIGAEVTRLALRLREVNGALWTVEDRLRDKEKDKVFDAEFVELARSVYRLNDERARIKCEVNVLLGSEITEEKSYQSY